MIKRVIVIVLDSFGIGELPDADLYGDIGSDTYKNILKYNPNMQLNKLNDLGLGAIDGVSLNTDLDNVIGAYGRMAEKSSGKDTTVGHWEMCGIVMDKPLPTFPNGFPQELILKIERAIGRKVIGNEVASGTEIIARLGKEHVDTGAPIIYTSADSVLQIAAHEEIVSIKELYEICETCRALLVGEYGVGRVIARPFETVNGQYARTKNRKDYSLLPVRKTILDYIKDANKEVIAIGKIEDIFAGQGITEAIHTGSNLEGIAVTMEKIKETSQGLIFTNLVDFDMKYGHRNDIDGYANALLEFDRELEKIMNAIDEDDVLIITADHGCDPTTASTDHSREYVPILIYGKEIKANVNIGTRESFADTGATILDLLNIEGTINGNSFKNLILK